MPNPHTPERERLYALLQKIRRDAGLSQAELAQRLGKPQSFVSKYESGERRLDFVEVWQICEAVGVSVEEFARTFSHDLPGRQSP